jgi:hypothetical protein
MAGAIGEYDRRGLELEWLRHRHSPEPSSLPAGLQVAC